MRITTRRKTVTKTLPLTTEILWRVERRLPRKLNPYQNIQWAIATDNNHKNRSHPPSLRCLFTVKKKMNICLAIRRAVDVFTTSYEEAWRELPTLTHLTHESSFSTAPLWIIPSDWLWLINLLASSQSISAQLPTTFWNQRDSTFHDRHQQQQTTSSPTSRRSASVINCYRPIVASTEGLLKKHRFPSSATVNWMPTQ